MKSLSAVWMAVSLTAIPLVDGTRVAHALALTAPVSTEAKGARCVGAAYDDTQAFQAAIDTGKSVYAPALAGHCNITHPLVMRTPGQVFYGDGRARTRLVVNGKFAGAGVFVAATGEPGPTWRDFSVVFDQPDVSDRAKLIRYPPAFSVTQTPRFELDHVGCYTATVCVDMKGNSGGSTISDFQMSAFETGIDIDGSLDTVRLIQVHGWPFNAKGPRQMKQMADGVTWLRVGRADDFKVVDGLLLGGTGLDLRESALGVATGSVTNTDFDGEHHGIVMSAGNMSVTGGYFPGGVSPNDQPVVIKGGTLGLYGTSIGCTSAGSPTPLGAIEEDGAQTTLLVVGSSMLCLDGDRPAFALNAGTAVFSNNIIVSTPNVGYRYPKIQVLGRNSRLTAIGNRAGDKGVGRGTFISIEADNFNRVIGNSAPGWVFSLADRPMPVTVTGSPGIYFAN